MISIRSAEFRLLAACVGTMGIADAAIWLRPAVTFEMIAKGLSEQAAGVVMTAELLLFALTMLLCARYAKGIQYLHLGLIGYVIAIGMSALSIVTDGLWVLAGIRAVAAIGFGILAAVPYAAAARLPDVQKGYGLLFTVGNLLSFLVLASLPGFEAVIDHSAPFIAFMALAALLLPLVLLLPRDDGFKAQVHHDESQGEEHRARWRRIVVFTLGFAIQGIAYQGVMSFYYTLATSAGMADRMVSWAMAAATLSSIGGSFFSARLARWIGKARFVYCAVVCVNMVLVGLLLVRDPILLAVLACMLMFVLFALYPAIFSIAAEIDDSGRGASFLQGGGMLVGATGPFLTGSLIEAGQLDLVAVGVVVLAAISLAITVLTLRKLGLHRPVAGDAGIAPPR